MSDISERVSTSYDIVGHPQQASKPVEEGKHYTVLAYTDWADSLIPTVIRWNHGEVDSFEDPEKSRRNQAKAIEKAEREAHEEAVLYHFGEGRLEAEDVDKSGNVIYPLCLKACPMGYTEVQIREGLCTEICEDAQEEDE